MSDPADRKFEDPARQAFRVRTKVSAACQATGSPGAAEGEFPRSLRNTNQQGSPSAENETPRVGLRPSAERDAKFGVSRLILKSCLSDPSPWNPWWPITIIFAVALGTAIGVYIVDGATWRKAFGFGTRLDTQNPPAQVSSPAARLPVASAAPQPANAASPAGGLPMASPAPQSDTAQSAGPPIASAAPQPTNAAPAAAIVPTATAAPQPTNAAPARVATAEEPRRERANHPRRD